MKFTGRLYNTWLAAVPTVLSAGVACATYVHANVKEQTLEDFNSRKKHIDDKVKHLYGPLYGNRLLYQAGIDAVKNFHQVESIEDLVKQICADRNAEGLEDWRGFYKRRLKKLDEKALDVIRNNSHLIHDDESRRILRAYLREASRQEYITEIWREGDRWDTRDDYNEKDWVPENNNYQFEEHRRLFIHIREMHRHLYKVRAEVDKELARTFSGIAQVDALINSVPMTHYSSAAELDETNFMGPLHGKATKPTATKK